MPKLVPQRQEMHLPSTLLDRTRCCAMLVRCLLSLVERGKTSHCSIEWRYNGQTCTATCTAPLEGGPADYVCLLPRTAQGQDERNVEVICWRRMAQDRLTRWIQRDSFEPLHTVPLPLTEILTFFRSNYRQVRESEVNCIFLRS